MARDDFPAAVIGVLAKRVANVCCNPDCRKQTSGPHTDDAKALNTGVAAHITAASAGGARYDASMTSEDRKSATNGIWLCQTCGKLVDNDDARYPVDRLRDWKRRAEEIALAEIENRPPSTGIIADSIQIAFDGWDIWRERGNLPGDEVIFITIWARNAVRYSVTLRIRNTSQHEEQLHKIRMQLRSKDTVLFDDWYSIQYELALPPHKWVSRQVDYGFNPGEDMAHYEKADSIWFAARIVGGTEEIAKKVADLDHAKPLRVI
jgi:hypothetical protein